MTLFISFLRQPSAPQPPWCQLLSACPQPCRCSNSPRAAPTHRAPSFRPPPPPPPPPPRELLRPHCFLLESLPEGTILQPNTPLSPISPLLSLSFCSPPSLTPPSHPHFSIRSPPFSFSLRRGRLANRAASRPLRGGGCARPTCCVHPHHPNPLPPQPLPPPHPPIHSASQRSIRTDGPCNRFAPACAHADGGAAAAAARAATLHVPPPAPGWGSWESPCSVARPPFIRLPTV